MKKDASRNTFHPEKHYRLVLMQQGRVQLDSDWNEQGDILAGRIEIETRDVVGRCGAPIHDAGFAITPPPVLGPPPNLEGFDLPPDRAGTRLPGAGIDRPGPGPQPGFTVADFLIGAGRYYAGGLLCINEQTNPPASYLHQPDYPSPPSIEADGLYLIYLDVWLRHITALDDAAIREVALGGPDTATRAKIVWQVKALFLGANAKASCATDLEIFKNLIKPPTGTMLARARKEQTNTNVCIVPPGAGYRGLENQFYRVEVHEGGNALDIGTAAAPVTVTRVEKSTNQVTFSGGSWQVGQAVEFLSTGSKNPMNGTLAHVTALDGGASKLTLDIDVSGFDFKDVRLRPVNATYKWSRDNGCVVTSIENIKGTEITVHDLGPDDVLGFQKGQWVEVTDDVAELNGRPGTLAQIIDRDPAINLITLNVAPPPLAVKAGQPDLSAHPKLRRWDGIGAIKFENPAVDDHDLELENGVLVRFSSGSYRTGDYWTVPARTATSDAQSGNIEWPADGSGAPLLQKPFGIDHHYCRLAMLHRSNGLFDDVQDCRKLFPPLTELTQFEYIGGDGQESLPGHDLEFPLLAGVFNGSVPVKDAPVRFVADGNGRVADTKAGLGTSTTNTLNTKTGADGIAKCFWRLDPDVSNPSQQVIATWLDGDSNVLSTIPFNGNLSIADEVFYDPGKCAGLAGRDTVQKAIRQLAEMVSLYEVSGNDQLIVPGVPLAQLVVLAANRCGPVAGRKVTFTVVSKDKGTVTPSATTDGKGLATATWTPDPDAAYQEVEATLVDDPSNSTAAPVTVRFTANVSRDKEPGVHIVSVRDATGKPIDNDTTIVIDRLFGGITITCDRELNELSAGPAPDLGVFPESTPVKPTCFLTLDLPYPMDASPRNFYDFGAIAAFTPTILAGNVVAKGKEIHWQPTDTAQRWLQILLPRLQQHQVADRVLAHLTAKGNFIWSTDDPPRYLDGEAFGIPAGKRTGLNFPSGNDRRGGDFEMWFWLRPAPQVPTLQITQANLQGIGGKLLVNGVPLPGLTVTLTGVPAFPPRTVTTSSDGSFFFPNVPAGSYQVSATVDGTTVKQPVTITNPILGGPPPAGPIIG